LIAFPTLAARNKGAARMGHPNGKRAKPAPIAGFRGPIAQNPAKIGISPTKTQENCGNQAFSH
jgi:hypothetical protein